MSSIPPISNDRIKALLEELHAQLPSPPTAVSGLYDCPKPLMRKIIKSNYSEKSLQQLSDHMGFYLGLYVRVKVRMVEESQFLRSNPHYKFSSGFYNASGDHKEIVLIRNNRYNFKHILAVMAPRIHP